MVGKRVSLAVVVILALVATACGGGSRRPAPAASESPDPPTAVATQTAIAVEATPRPRDLRACPVNADACVFAEAVMRWLLDADVQALKDRSRPQELPCRGSGQGAGGNSPLCDGAPAGTTRPGFPIHVFNSDGYTAQADFRPALRESILNGPGVVELVGFHCPEKDARADCGSVFVLFLIGAANLQVDRIDGAYFVTALQFGHFAQDPAIFDSGGTFPIAAEDAGTVPGRFEPWRPAVTSPGLPNVIDRWLDAHPWMSRGLHSSRPKAPVRP